MNKTNLLTNQWLFYNESKCFTVYFVLLRKIKTKPSVIKNVNHIQVRLFR